MKATEHVADDRLPAVLFAVSGAAACAQTPSEAAQGILSALLEAGLIRAGAVGIHAPERSLHEVGDTGHLPESVAGSPDAQPAEGLHSRSFLVPCQSADPAWAYLVSDVPLDDALVHVVSEQLGAALDRIHLRQTCESLRAAAEQRVREVSTIYDIGRAVQHTDTAGLMQLITERAALVMAAPVCSLMRLDPDTRSLYIAANHGLPADVVVAAQRTLGEGIAGRVAASGEPILVTPRSTDPRLTGLSLRPEIGSSIVVPLTDESGAVMGVLSIRRHAPAPEFTQDDLRLLTVFATHAALTISNAQLYDDLRRRVNELSTVSELTQAVISHLHVDRLLDIIADSVVDVVKMSRCCIYLLDRDTKRFVPRIVRGYRPEQVGRRPIRLGDGVVGLVARKQMPIVVQDAAEAIEPMRSFARALGAESFVAVPMMSRGQAIGVVVADDLLANRRIRPASVELLTTFVNHAGIAIENAQLYEDRELRYQEMNRLAAETENILRSIGAAVVVVDSRERIARWNRAAEELMGLREADVIGQAFVTVLRQSGLLPAETSVLQQRMRAALKRGRPHQGYKLALHPRCHGAIAVNVLLSPVTDLQGAQQGAVLVAEDVTREIALEAENVRMRRLADIGQLAAKIAHEVRNPLSSIKGAAQLMRTQHEDPARLHEFLGIIVDEVNGLNRLTTDLLTFARPMRLGLRDTNLNDLVDRALRLLDAQIRQQEIEVRALLQPELPDVVADPDQLGQVLRNVLLNAVQAMPEGGTLTCRTEYRSAAGTVVLTCSDTGVGIPSDKLDDVFQPFYTTKARGTGLGLPIVRRIVERHGGVVTVSSAPGHGATIRVELPLTTPQEAAVEPDRYVTQGVSGAPLPDE